MKMFSFFLSNPSYVYFSAVYSFCMTICFSMSLFYGQMALFKKIISYINLFIRWGGSYENIVNTFRSFINPPPHKRHFF